MIKLTRKEKVLLEYIKSYYAEYEDSPTLREIGEFMKWKSLGTCHRYSNQLVQKGHLEKAVDGWAWRNYKPVESN